MPAAAPPAPFARLPVPSNPRKVKCGRTSQFNSGPTPRDAIWDFIRLVEEYPEVWDKL